MLNSPWRPVHLAYAVKHHWQSMSHYVDLPLCVIALSDVMLNCCFTAAALPGTDASSLAASLTFVSDTSCKPGLGSGTGRSLRI